MEKIKMIKKMLICVLCLMLILTVMVSATGTEETTPSVAESTVPEESGELQPGAGGGRPGGRGGMGGMAPGGERPQMPESEFTPPGEEMLQGTEENQSAEALQTPENGEDSVPEQGMGRDQMPQQWQQDGAAQNTAMTVTAFLKEYQTPVISVVLLILSFVFVKLYKRKTY